MTMLDRMRRHRAWLKWSLGLVVVTFVLLYVPSFLDPAAGTGTNPTDSLATVEGRDITVGSYQRIYQQQLVSLRQNSGSQLTDDIIRQLQIPQRVIQQMIDQEAVAITAERLGLRVTDAELRERIMRMPGFQQDGQFIGDTRYRQVLAMQRPPMRAQDFEEQLRKDLLSQKLQTAVTAWVQISPDDADAEYRLRNEKINADLAVFTAAQFSAGINPSDADIATYFAANQETYRTPEKRRVRYLSIDAQALQASRVVTNEEIETYYNDNRAQFTTPEQVRASHILFKTGEGKDEAAQRKLAEEVLAKVNAGGDFAALAKEYSEDTSAAQGGDLNFFNRETMVKEFSDAAFALQPGQVSDIVQSQFGFHIIKVTERRPGGLQPLAEVRAQIENQLKMQKAQAEAQTLADDAAKEIDDASDLDRVAQAHGLTVSDSGLFARDEPLAGLGFAPTVASQAFSMPEGAVSGKLQTSTGFAFISLTEVRAPGIPALAEVKDRVKDDLIRVRSVEVAQSRAASMARAARRGSFAAAAKAAGVDVKSTGLVSRGSPYPDMGVSTPIDDVLFGLAEGATSDPIETDTAVVVARVTDRVDVQEDDMIAARPTLSEEVLSQRRNQFFTAYINKAKQKLRITYNENALRTILGTP